MRTTSEAETALPLVSAEEARLMTVNVDLELCLHHTHCSPRRPDTDAVIIRREC